MTKEIDLKTELLKKLETKSMTREEANELKQILEREKSEAANIGDFVKVVLLVILIAAVIALIAELFSD